mmetsp:Transcript_141153/g.352053  ORF Transcript_141153/g.352053 Transcript_141153/m.352053 type:complete len:146 (-) Transcript_141153:162-599(-)|eukprot:CAMPEP_0115647644 /NCGR_PEP_ID=MMETSP0272-20121206/39558_1 /TAXON_ID=71861 /ORGANISM="Scrippsiella trochoidea, Strain CCMP3099" /LENGTH=145 /DNA_ID=CAMNT_0003085221 /DNA_START=32 /DNA_END=469 /DNA_ORIENTATION=-
MLKQRNKPDLQVTPMSMPEGVRKREVRAACRFFSLCAVLFLAINIITLHSWQILPLAATGLFTFAAIGNLIAGFADEGSVHSCCSSCGNILMTLGSSIVWLLQAFSNGSQLSFGLNFLAFIMAVILIVVNLVLTMVSVIGEDIKR